MTTPVLGTPAGLGRGRLAAHVDVWKDDGGQRVLVSTTRPCAVCGQPLAGVVVPVNTTEQAHAACRK